MNSTAGILARIPLFKLYRKFGWPQLLPLNLTLSPSPKCNSRCLTCNIWMKRENELTIEEWDKVLASLGQAPYWFTISGGEPLMYPHVVELAQLAYKHCSPGVINIPTNAILPNIPERVERIAKSCPNSQLIINLSLDGVGAKHDHIRGIPGNFAKFEQSLKQLLSLRKTLKNLTVGIHSVVSVFSVGHLDELIAYADKSGADQFITEIAEPRVELDTVGLPITPTAEEYARAIDRLIDYVESKRFTGVAKITEALRVEYYKLGKRADLCRRHGLALLRARRQSGQSARPSLRFQGDLVRRQNQGSTPQHRRQGMSLPAGQRLVHKHAAQHSDSGARGC